MKYDFLIAGDFCPFETSLADKLTINDTLINLLSNSSFHIVNLECPITSSTKQIKKTGPALKTDPTAIILMKKLGITHCSLANNHIKDYGVKGIKDTVEILTKNDIKNFGIEGIYSTDQTIIDINGWRVAFISFTENEFSTDHEDNCWAIGLDYSKQYQQISDLRKIADYIIVLYHGGVEMYEYPTPGQQKYCRYLIDCGASLVICNHSHCISGFENYKSKKILYGLGNFFFPETGNPNSWYSGLVLGISFKNYTAVDIIPVYYDQNRKEIGVDIENKYEILNRIEQINKIITSQIDLEREWRNYCNMLQKQTLKTLFQPNLFVRAMMYLPFFNNFLKHKVNLVLLNNLRCESHYEKIMETIKQILKENQ